MPFLVAVLIIISVLQKRERNHIKFLQMLICNRRKKIKEDTKKKKSAEQTPLTTQQLDSLQQCQKKTLILYMPKPLSDHHCCLLPAQPSPEWFPK